MPAASRTPPPAASHSPMQRTLIGLIAIALLAAGLAVHLLSENELWRGSFVRVGIFAALVWIAYPQLQLLGRLPMWLAATLGIVAVIVLAAIFRRPQAIAMLLGIVLLLIKLKPWATAVDEAARRAKS